MHEAGNPQPNQGTKGVLFHSPHILSISSFYYSSDRNAMKIYLIKYIFAIIKEGYPRYG